jgi:hypothetical protein
MSHPPEDFDFEATLQQLADAARAAPAPQQAALELAANALHFLYVENRLGAFRDYLREARAPAHLAVRIEREFDGLPQATGWLHAAPPPAHGTLVKVAGKTFAVWRDEAGQLQLVPSFTPQELDALK